ncbi:phosphatidylserine decarboxylase proenzyme, mitochondrial isoform X2 [Neocloeon triangulifer]|uniref:phosphatidylserine decarboxylase proenzyme, mitochondrial isoform X2 n=1 Tax=Neocloeon triangulifer TaxID=2078957 RepID=UPI00286F57B7|nr:phosphatidylserine decarboxylase proenzyme, mitochondrial isoform X2 [Neocloeon triangulifer]
MAFRLLGIHGGLRCAGLQPALLLQPPRVAFLRHASAKSSKGEQGWRSTQNLRYLRLPLGVGFVLLAVLQWRHIRQRLEKEEEHAKDWEITCYRLMPLRALSRVWGWAMEKEVPKFARPHLFSWYATAFGCDLNEAEEPNLAAYSSLGQFFGRSLKHGARPINCNDLLVSPADGRVLQVGPVTGSRVEQVKGVTYSLEAFLGEPNWMSETQWGRPTLARRLLHNERGTRLYQCVIYLAPGDYHRFHSPAEWRVNFRRHFQGELLSVNPMVARLIPDLFSLNERAVYVGSWKHGFFSLTAVGATNVGSIRVYCDEELRTNQPRWPRHQQRHKDTYLGPTQEGVPMAKGQLFGEFKLGSTVVLLFEAPEDFHLRPGIGERILVGQPMSLCDPDAAKVTPDGPKTD